MADAEKEKEQELEKTKTAASTTIAAAAAVAVSSVKPVSKASKNSALAEAVAVNQQNQQNQNIKKLVDAIKKMSDGIKPKKMPSASKDGALGIFGAIGKTLSDLRKDKMGGVKKLFTKEGALRALSGVGGVAGTIAGSAAEKIKTAKEEEQKKTEWTSAYLESTAKGKKLTKTLGKEGASEEAKTLYDEKVKLEEEVADLKQKQKEKKGTGVLGADISKEEQKTLEKSEKRLGVLAGGPERIRAAKMPEMQTLPTVTALPAKLSPVGTSGITASREPDGKIDKLLDINQDQLDILEKILSASTESEESRLESKKIAAPSFAALGAKEEKPEEKGLFQTLLGGLSGIFSKGMLRMIMGIAPIATAIGGLTKLLGPLAAILGLKMPSIQGAPGSSPGIPDIPDKNKPGTAPDTKKPSGLSVPDVPDLPDKNKPGTAPDTKTPVGKKPGRISSMVNWAKNAVGMVPPSTSAAPVGTTLKAGTAAAGTVANAGANVAGTVAKTGANVAGTAAGTVAKTGATSLLKSGAARAIPGVGTVLAVGMGAKEAYDANASYEAGDITEKDRNKQYGSAGGGVAGGLAGAAAGAALGSVVPVFGTAIGGLVGGALGYFGGSTAGSGVGGMFGADTKKGEKAVIPPTPKPVTAAPVSITATPAATPVTLAPKPTPLVLPKELLEGSKAADAKAAAEYVSASEAERKQIREVTGLSDEKLKSLAPTPKPVTAPDTKKDKPQAATTNTEPVPKPVIAPPKITAIPAVDDSGYYTDEEVEAAENYKTGDAIQRHIIRTSTGLSDAVLRDIAKQSAEVNAPAVTPSVTPAQPRAVTQTAAMQSRTADVEDAKSQQKPIIIHAPSAPSSGGSSSISTNTTIVRPDTRSQEPTFNKMLNRNFSFT